MVDESPPSPSLIKILRLVDGSTRTIVASTKDTKKESERQRLLSDDGRTQRANIRKSEFVALISQGFTPEKACREIGIQKSTYYQWRKQNYIFKSQVELARQQWYEENNVDTPGRWKDFISFRKRFFGMSTYPLQQQIVDALETAEEMEVVLILVAPETGKTTLLEDKICHEIGQNPNIRVAYISEGSGHSRKVCARIRRRMTDTSDHGDFISRYGPFYKDGQERNGKVWSTDRFTVSKADHDERDYTFESKGARSNIQGSRIDLMVLDDVQSIKSLSQTGFLIDQFRQEFIPRVGKKGKIIVIGTRVGLGDFYESLIQLELIDRLIELPIVDPNGQSLCPELWPSDKLEKRRKQVGEDVWARTYMQDPMAAVSTTFSEEVREASKDHNRTIKKSPGVATVMSLDPGLGGGNCFTVAQYTYSKLEIVDQITDYKLGRTEEILERVVKLASLYRPSDFIIEMMAFQNALGKDDRMLALGRQYGFRIYPHVTTRDKYDSTYGVASMAGSMRCGEMTIPWGDEYCEDGFQSFLDEAKVWRPISGKKLVQDRVMSVWFIWLFWIRMRESLLAAEKHEFMKMRSLPWRGANLRLVKR